MGVRQKQKEATRERILEAARELFEDRTVASVSIAEVARAASIAPGTVYVHFPSKDALALAVADHLDSELLEDLHGVFAHTEAADTSALIHDVAVAYLATWRRCAPLIGVFAHRQLLRLGAGELQAGGNIRAPEAIARGLRPLFVSMGSPHDPAALARLLDGAWRAAALHAVAQPPDDDEGSAALLAEATIGILERTARGILAIPVPLVKQAFAAMATGGLSD